MDSIKERVFKFLHLDSLIENVTGFAEAKLELYKMEIREDVAKVLSRAIVYATIGFFGFLLLMFLSIGLAHYLNTYFTETYVGFWIVAGLYAVVFVIFLLFKKGIDKNFEKHFTEMIRRKHK
jgi:Putative Actinobacterial Holin-X, holin superfamily III